MYTLFEQGPDYEGEDGPTIQFDLSTGRRLAEARKQLNMTVEDVAENLFLSEDIINAIETRSYSSLPSVAYATGYVRAYAKYVNLDPNQLIRADPDLGLLAIDNEVKSNLELTGPQVLDRGGSASWKWIGIAIKGAALLIVLSALFFGWTYRDDISAWWTEKVISDRFNQIEEETDPQSLEPLQPLNRPT